MQVFSKPRIAYQTYQTLKNDQRLVVPNAHPQDGGVYKCVMKNAYGKVKRSKKFFVEG